MAGHHQWLIFNCLTGFLDPNREISTGRIAAKNTPSRISGGERRGCKSGHRFSKGMAEVPDVVRVLRMSYLPEDGRGLTGTRTISSRGNACPARIAA